MDMLASKFGETENSRSFPILKHGTAFSTKFDRCAVEPIAKISSFGLKSPLKQPALILAVANRQCMLDEIILYFLRGGEIQSENFCAG